MPSPPADAPRRPPFTAASPSSRPDLRLRRLVDADCTMSGLPPRVPAARLPRRPLSRAKPPASPDKNAEVVADSLDVGDELSQWRTEAALMRAELAAFQRELDAQGAQRPTGSRPSTGTGTGGSRRKVGERLDLVDGLRESSQGTLPKRVDIPHVQVDSVDNEGGLKRTPAKEKVPTPTIDEQEISPLQKMRLLRAQLAAENLSTERPPVERPTKARPKPKPNPASKSRRAPAAAPPSPLPPPPPAANLSAFAAEHAFSLQHLPPLTHHSRTGILTLHPPTHLTLVLRDANRGGSRFNYTIPSSAGAVTVTDVRTNTVTQYTLEDLPWRHLRAYRYAQRFVAAVRRKTILAYGGVDGARGRLWADGRCIVEIGGYNTSSPAAEVRFPARAVFVRGQPVAHPDARVLRIAEHVYAWLRRHPAPSYQVDMTDSAAAAAAAAAADDDVRLIDGCEFVRDVGWCRRDADGNWWMLFIDGVRLEIERASGTVRWTEPHGKRRMPKGGIDAPEVRERVRAFVEARE